MIFTKRAIKIVGYFLFSMLVILAALLFALQFRATQTFLAKKAASYLSQQLHAKIDIGELYFKPFSALTLKNLYVEDEAHDTLLYAPELTASLELQLWRKKSVVVNQLELQDSRFYLKTLKNKKTNLAFILDYINKPGSKKEGGQSLQFDIHRVDVKNARFKYDYEGKVATKKGIDFQHVDVHHLSGTLEHIDLENHRLKAHLKDWHLWEKSGFELRQLNAEVLMEEHQLEFSQLLVRTNSSQLGHHLRFQYTQLADFSEFVDRVQVEATLKNSRIRAEDVAFFAPDLGRITFDVGLEGTVSGKVGNFVAKSVLLQAGKGTYFRGNALVKGLPQIEQTTFNLDIEQLSSNKEDLTSIVSGFMGQKELILPNQLEALGQVYYGGSLRGLYHDFELDGSLKTAIGQITAQGHLAFGESSQYEGALSTDYFNLGALFDNKELGGIALSAAIDGEGFRLDDMDSHMELEVSNVEYGKWKLHDISLDAALQHGRVQGDWEIRDSLLTLLNGKAQIDLHDRIPAYRWSGSLAHLDLHGLSLVKDSLTLQGTLSSFLQGENINDLNGAITFRQMSVRGSLGSSAFIDSLLITAEGSGHDRKIAVSSDVLDLSMRGIIDLYALPDYVQSVAKRYLPSWDADLQPGIQDFDFALRLKNARPLLLFFAPAIQIPDTVIANGIFSTQSGTATLNAYVPLVELGRMKLRHVILDEVAMDRSLNLTVTADQFNITDSLYVKNINISNILHQDSLLFNIKLSDVDAKNQMDLNGLVAFRENEMAHLNLLPSDIVIDEQKWKLEEQVRLALREKAVQVDGFVLSNGDQRVKVGGLISKESKDVLNVSFEQFNLSTLSGLTNPLGIELQGKLNGDFQVFSALKNPYVSADVKSSDIYYNGREIGDLTLLAEMDPATQLVGMNMEINRRGSQTLQIRGSYDATADDHSLALKASLSNSELVVFEPFLKKLVSGLEGTVSADMDISGTPWSPVISGTCDFHQAAFTVNYLKTRYVIDDRVSIHNSRIDLQDLHIQDQDGHLATANGSVDMGNPLDPLIDVAVHAQNFMVLNTTSKDNALYYGAARGTGDFIFKGATSNMDIDIKASTEAGTIFNIPLNASGTVGDRDFITFVSKDSTFSETRSSYFDGLTLHMDLNITRDAQANIFTDLGKLSGEGTGNIIMNITTLGDFEMFGDYLIAEGKFTFTAQDFINKIFEINRGGTIRWTGNPSDALINLTAVYEVRTSVKPLYLAAGRTANDQRVVAQAEMNLAGNLSHPDISFALEFPTDTYVKEELQSYLSDVNSVNQQALSLIVRRSFAPGTGADLTTEINSTFLSAGTELAFNQLNNIISQSLNLNFVDFNIRSLNEASASIRLLNNRLVLTGGVTDRRSQLNDLNVFGSQVASDVEAVYLIRKNGNLMLRASNRLNNRNFLNPTDEYVSALGLVYRQDFDTLGEFFKRMFTISRQKREEAEKDGKDKVPVNTEGK